MYIRDVPEDLKRDFEIWRHRNGYKSLREAILAVMMEKAKTERKAE